MRRHPADRQLLPRQPLVRAGDRVLAPVRGRIHIVDRRRHISLVQPDVGDPLWIATTQITTAAWEPVVPCPGCGLPAHRDTGCHTCRPAPPQKESASMDNTKIEWSDATWNAVTGCTKVSPGCDHCYAETIANRFAGTKAYPDGFAVTLHHDRLDQPIRWKRPRRIFANSMSDMFHDDIPTEYIAQMFAVMLLAPQHQFQILTKRPGRMRSLLTSDQFIQQVRDIAHFLKYDSQPNGNPDPRANDENYRTWPLPNVWLGVSTEDQRWANVRIPVLLSTPAAVRFISAEPLLGAIDLLGTTEKPGPAIISTGYSTPTDYGTGIEHGRDDQPGLDWVIVGGESGPRARPMHPHWARDLRDQCELADIAFLFKQWGEWAPDEHIDDDGTRHVHLPPDAKDPKRLVIHQAGMTAMHPDNPFNPFEHGHPHWATAMRRAGKKQAGRQLDGRTHDGFPA